MTTILDRVAESSSKRFRPQTAEELFALRLSKKLRDVESARTYVALLDRFSENTLLDVYRRVVTENCGGDLAERFRIEIQRLMHREDR